MNAIFSVFHKKYFVPKNKIVFPILVGENKNTIELNITKKIYRDDVGYNIAEFNSHFCELTALYWIWKNFKQNEDDFVGIVHYRRYLILDQKRKIFDRLKNKLLYYIFSKNKYQQIKLNERLKDKSFEFGINEILVDKKFILAIPNQIIINDKIYTVKEQYLLEHIESDWYVLENSLKSLYPEYSKIFDEFAKETYMSIGNVFICKRCILDVYCVWLFPLLFDVKAKISISENQYQARVLGFMAERLLNIYIIYNFKREEISYLPIYYLLNQEES